MPKIIEHSAIIAKYKYDIKALEQQLKNQHDSYNVTIRKLSDKCAERGGRMQRMKEFMERRRVGKHTPWEFFCGLYDFDRPETWFDEHGNLK